jgi:hypothetical protein
MKKKSIKNPITIEKGRLAALLRKERELYYLKERDEMDYDEDYDTWCDVNYMSDDYLIKKYLY